MNGTSVFGAHGASAYAIARLGWWLTGVSLLVIVVVAALLLIALFRRRGSVVGAGQVSDTGEATGRRWVMIGTWISVLILLGTFVYTVAVLAGNSAGLRGASLHIRIIGAKYWWKVEYLDVDGHVNAVTANEVHIPVGQPTHLDLQSADVIHSFWVPELAGKIDLMPGQTNAMWIEASSVGRYGGQCAEYCGGGHANMGILVVVDSAPAFARWLAADRLPATAPPAAEQQLFEDHGCAACHAIAGTPAAGTAGPDLTHMGSRTTLAAGVIPNTSAELARWLSAPELVKPGTLMPNSHLAPDDLSQLVAMLERLK